MAKAETACSSPIRALDLTAPVAWEEARKMNFFDDWPGSETLEVEGYTVTRGCCLSTSGKWWPMAAVGVGGGSPLERRQRARA